MDDGARLSARDRRFAFTVGGVMLMLAVVSLWRGHVWPPRLLAGVGVALVLAGTLFPRRVGPFRGGWIALGAAMSRVTTPVLLGAVYFLVLTPTGLLRRTFGRSPMRPHAPGESGWKTRQRPGSDMTRQF